MTQKRFTDATASIFWGEDKAFWAFQAEHDRRKHQGIGAAEREKLLELLGEKAAKWQRALPARGERRADRKRALRKLTSGAHSAHAFLFSFVSSLRRFDDDDPAQPSERRVGEVDRTGIRRGGIAGADRRLHRRDDGELPFGSHFAIVICPARAAPT